MIEKSNEYQLPLCLTFVDCEKAFDSMKTNAVIEALANQNIQTKYVKAIQEIYTNATATIKLHEDSSRLQINRSVRQGDTTSPKLFTSVLE